MTSKPPFYSPRERLLKLLFNIVLLLLSTNFDSVNGIDIKKLFPDPNNNLQTSSSSSPMTTSTSSFDDVLSSVTSKTLHTKIKQAQRTVRNCISFLACPPIPSFILDKIPELTSTPPPPPEVPAAAAAAAVAANNNNIVSTIASSLPPMPVIPDLILDVKQQIQEKMNALGTNRLQDLQKHFTLEKRNLIILLDEVRRGMQVKYSNLIRIIMIDGKSILVNQPLEKQMFLLVMFGCVILPSIRESVILDELVTHYWWFPVSLLNIMVQNGIQLAQLGSIVTAIILLQKISHTSTIPDLVLSSSSPSSFTTNILSNVIKVMNNIPVEFISKLAYRIFLIMKAIQIKDYTFQEFVSNNNNQDSSQQLSSNKLRMVQRISLITNYVIYLFAFGYLYQWLTNSQSFIASNGNNIWKALLSSLNYNENSMYLYKLIPIGGMILAGTFVVFQEVIAGVLLSLTGHVLPGDTIRLAQHQQQQQQQVLGSTGSKGIAGTVVSLGLLRTTLVSSIDQSVVSIPNSVLAKQPVSNLSRMVGQQQVIYQSLYFPLEDTEKIEGVCESILDEIRMKCPELIENDNINDDPNINPFIAHWTDINTEYLTVQVEAHFDIPITDITACMENKERVLHCINRAVKKHQMDYYETSTTSTNTASSSLLTTPTTTTTTITETASPQSPSSSALEV